MCKVLIINGVDAGASAELKKFVEAARPLLTRDEPHGFGYAALNASGMFGERWLNVSEAFRVRNETSLVRKSLGGLASALRIPDEYSAFGNVSTAFEGVTSIALHARTSTNSISLMNTHPFVLNDYALIHNGVISNQKQLKNTISSCDSECILHEYNDVGVANDLKKIQDVADGLHGYFACAVLGNNGEHWHLDVFKDSRASLYFAVVAELGNTKVWCTSDAVLKQALAKAKFRRAKVYRVRDNYAVRMHAVTGACIEVFEFDDCMGAWDWRNQSGHETAFQAIETAERAPEYTEAAREQAERDYAASLAGRYSPDEDDLVIGTDGLEDGDADVYELIRGDVRARKA